MKLLNLDFNETPKKSLQLLDDLNIKVISAKRFKILTQSCLESHLSNHSYDIIFMRLGFYLSDKILMNQKKLKFIVSATTGHNHLNEPFIKQTNIKLISLKYETKFLESIQSTSEHVWALLLNVCKNIPKSQELISNGLWERSSLKGFELNSKVVGIIGYGRLGKIVSKYAKAFNMKILTYDSNDLKHNQSEYTSDLNLLLKSSDVIILLIDYKKENHNFFNKNLFSLMKENSIFINCSRGECVDEDSLIYYVKEKKPFGIGLDVLNNDSSWQKIPENHKIIELSKKTSNFIITPHIGGYSDYSVNSTREFVIKKLIKNLKS